MTSATRRVVRGVSSGVLGVAVRIVSQLTMVPILYSSWDAARAATWLLVWTLPGYMVLTVGAFSAAGGNIAVAASQDGRIGEVRAAYRATRITINASSAALILLIAASSPALLSEANREILAGSLPALLAAIAAYVLCRVKLASFEVPYRHGGDYAEPNIIESVASLAELAAMFAVVRLSDDLVVLAGAFTAIRVAQTIVLSRRARRRWPEVFAAADRDVVRSTLRAMAVPFLGFMIAPVLLAININGYSLLINKYFPIAQLQIFLITRMLCRLVDNFNNTFFFVLFYEFGYIKANDRDRLLGATGATDLIMALAGLAYGAFLLLFGEAIQQLWTNGKVPFSKPLAAIFIAAMLLRAIAIPPTALLSLRNRHAAPSFAYLAFSALGLALAMVLAVGGASLTMVAAAVLIGEVAQVVVFYRATGGQFGLSGPRLARAMARHAPEQSRTMLAAVLGPLNRRFSRTGRGRAAAEDGG